MCNIIIIRKDYDIPQLIFDFDLYNEEYKYEVTYKENYKVGVVSRKNEKKYIIEIFNRSDEYLYVYFR